MLLFRVIFLKMLSVCTMYFIMLVVEEEYQMVIDLPRIKIFP